MEGGILPDEAANTAGVLRIKKGSHNELNDNVIPPYLLIRNLASSSKAVIDVVKDVITEAVYVRKTIRHAQPQNHSQIEQYMRNEVVAMRYMSVHRHFVALHATYVQRGELSLIVDPVANQGDLGSFLQHIKASERPPNESQKNILLSAFGCLANGLDFMHHQTIRHKIIDPQSIFIHFDRVLYTNFGLSFDFGTAGNISSSGPLEGLNLRYAAPEVRQWGQGDRKSDVFSLACVYVEILTALFPDIFLEVDLRRNFSDNIDEISTTLKGLAQDEGAITTRYHGEMASSANTFRGIMFVIGDKMLCPTAYREDAAFVVNSIQSHQNAELLFCEGCNVERSRHI